MKFISTRNKEIKATFKEALFKGLSPDGGLFCPEKVMGMADFFTNLKEGESLNNIAQAIVKNLLGNELDEKTANKIVNNAFDFSPVLRRVTDQISILELFHGPSCAFKDYGASFMAAAMEEFLLEENKRTIILVATSGDTGSAVARAFHKKKNIDVVILYPSGRVSPLQEQQLTTLGDNVTALEIDGAFDDCQRMVKEVFMEEQINKSLVLTSANSINLGRLIPQSFYYVYAYAQLPQAERENFYFCVPSGNFGNLTAGVYAWTWGMPVKGFIAATNANDVVPEYLNTKAFNPRPSVHTLSNAMDVGNPSNFERLTNVFGDDHEKLSTLLSGEVITDEETKETIKRIKDEYDLFIDPHTAVGYLATERFLKKTGHKGRVIILSTAHPAKFIETVEDSTGIKPELPEALAKTLGLEKKSIKMKASSKDLSEYLLKNYK